MCSAETVLDERGEGRLWRIPIVLAQASQILNPTGFRNTLSHLPKLTSYLVFPHVVNDHAPLPDAQRPGWCTLTCPFTLLSIASHFHLLNIFWNCPLHLIPCYRLALCLHHLSRRLVEWPPNWSPCPQQQPVKDILHTTVRVIFQKCKSDDHFTPFLWPFSDFPWQKSKLLCSAQKALCGLVPESLQPHFWPFAILLPRQITPTASVILSDARLFHFFGSLLMCSFCLVFKTQHSWHLFCDIILTLLHSFLIVFHLFHECYWISVHCRLVVLIIGCEE